MKRRAFVFTLDAVLALLLALIFITSITAIATNSNQVYMTQIQIQNKAVAQHLLETLRTVPLSNLVSPTKIGEWIDEGVLNLTYVNPQMPPLQIVATYWALSQRYPQFKTYAEEMLGYLLANMTRGYKYQLIINNYTSPYLTFDNSYENASDVGSATIMVSGYVPNETPRGYVAKAYLTKLVASQHELITLPEILAGRVTDTQPLGYYSVSFYYYFSNRYFELDSLWEPISSVSVLSSSWGVAYVSGIPKIMFHYTITNVWGNRYSGYIDYIIYSPDNSTAYVIYPINGISISYFYNPFTGTIWGLKIWGDDNYAPVSRFYFNALNITTSIDLPGDASNITGEWLMINAYGIDNILAENPSTSINGYILNNPQRDTSLEEPPLKPGENTIEVNDRAWLFYYRQQLGIWYGFLALNYTTGSPISRNPGFIKLWNVTSKYTGFMYFQPVFVPGNITNVTLRLTVSGVHVVRVYFHSVGHNFTLIYKNSSLSPSETGIMTVNLLRNLTEVAGIDLLNTRSWNLVIALDSYYNETAGRFYYAGQDYNYSQTNKRVLYGYPYSYVNVSYTSNLSVDKFMIPMDILKVLQPPGNTNVSPSSYPQYMYFTYYLPDMVIPWYVTVTTDRFINITNGYPNGTLTVKEGPNALYEVVPPFPLDYYMIQFSYRRLNDNIMVPGSINEFKIESSSEDYTFRPWNSRAIVHYFLNGYAPYGKIFTYYAQKNACGYNLTYYYNLSGQVNSGTVLIGNCRPTQQPLQINASQLEPDKYALDDAIYRLFLQLGARNETTYLPGTAQNPIAVNLRGLQVEAIGIRNVPVSISPIQVTLRIWRG